MIGDSYILISKQSALNAMCDNCEAMDSSCPNYPCKSYLAVEKLSNVCPSLYGYRLEELAIIATILNKEGLPPERVSEALIDVDRIVAMIRVEFQEQLRKTIEHLNTSMKGENVNNEDI